MYLVTRIAPTPSGYLHWGNAFSFVLTWLYAQRMSARVLLRIDDLDAARKRPEYVEDVFRSLDWMGMTYDLGPSGPDDFEANYSQRHRYDLYHQSLKYLETNGQVFACLCSRADILSSPNKLHSAMCSAKGHSMQTQDACWRLPTKPMLEEWIDLNQVHRTVDLHHAMRDPIVRRKNGLPAYQLASVVDDAYFGVNLVIRGEDLVASTAVQRWISRILPQTDFHQAQLLHHQLITDSEGRKLSKSHGPVSLLDMRNASPTPAPLFRRLSSLLGLNKPVDTLQQTLEGWQGQHAT